MKNYLVNKILDKYEKSQADWNKKQSGGRSIKIQQEHYDELQDLLNKEVYLGYGMENCCDTEEFDTEEFVTGKECLLKEALWLKSCGLIEIKKWRSYGNDIEKIEYSLENIMEFYRIAKREPKFASADKKRKRLCFYQDQIASDWIKQYYQSCIEEAERGMRVKKESEKDTREKKKRSEEEMEELIFKCLSGIEKLQTPTYIRLFSANCLGESKIFEEELETKILFIAKKYHPFVVEDMDKYRILEQLYLDTYSQRLELKGDLKILLDGEEIDLSVYKYGTILNSETLKKAVVAKEQSVKKIITIENKANFVSMPYEEGTLILFSHGFFSPLERDFLKQLEAVLKDGVAYFHTGDLDYGGIRIFKHIREQIFPLLQPYQMSVEQYQKYEYNAIDIEKSALEKLQKMKEPFLQDLIDYICEKKKIIEQESFLF